MSELLELLPWADQIKSHLSTLLSYFNKYRHLDLASGILLAYLLLIAIKPTPAKNKIACAAFVSLATNYSPLYDLLNNVQFYSLYSLIYITTARYVSNKKIKYTLVIMSIFEFTMGYDRYVNAGTATWLYDSFEEITCIIHGLIISSSLKLKPINLGAILGRLTSCLRGLAHSNCLTSHL